MMHGVFGEFALLLLMSAAAGAISLWLRQPVLIAHIAMGLAESQCDVLVICDPREATDDSP